jgi:hypothetical protein
MMILYIKVLIFLVFHISAFSKMSESGFSEYGPETLFSYYFGLMIEGS